MRKLFFILCGAVMLHVLPAWGHECREIQTPVKQRVDQHSPGYVPVAVIIKMPVEEGTDPQSVAHKGDFTFWMESDGTGIKQNRNLLYLQSVRSCSGVYLFRDGKRLQSNMLKLTLRGLVTEQYDAQHGFVLGAGIFLPSSLVRSRPAVGTTLNSGKEFRGVWGTDKGYPLLTLIAE